MPSFFSRITSGLSQLREHSKNPLVMSKFICFATILISLIVILVLDNTNDTNRLIQPEKPTQSIHAQELVSTNKVPELPGSISFIQNLVIKLDQTQKAYTKNDQEHDQNQKPELVFELTPASEIETKLEEEQNLNAEQEQKHENKINEMGSDTLEKVSEPETLPSNPVLSAHESKNTAYIPYGLLKGEYTRTSDLGKYQIVGYDAYCTHCVFKSNPDGITASGVKATVGRTVATHKSIPFGTILEIEGLGYYVVEDRGVDVGMVDVASANHASCYMVTSQRQVWIVEETRKSVSEAAN